MTRQELFDRVVNHAATQKSRATGTINGSETCRFRTSDNKKCFAGIFIPDEMYTGQLEFYDVYRLEDGGFLPEVNKQDVRVLKDLQAVHDIHPPSEWHKDFKDIARVYDLTYNGAETDYV